MKSQFANAALYGEQETVSKCLGCQNLTLIGDTRGFTQGYETFQRALVRLPVLQEEAGSSWHRQDIGVGGTDVCLQLIFLTEGIVVIYEGHAITGIVLVV